MNSAASEVQILFSKMIKVNENIESREQSCREIDAAISELCEERTKAYREEVEKVARTTIENNASLVLQETMLTQDANILHHNMMENCDVANIDDLNTIDVGNLQGTDIVDVFEDSEEMIELFEAIEITERSQLSSW